MRAVRIGRDASRHTRRGEEAEAAVDWTRSAIEWRNLGDDRRANIAQSYASGYRNQDQTSGRRLQRVTPPDEPLLSDLVA